MNRSHAILAGGALLLVALGGVTLHLLRSTPPPSPEREAAAEAGRETTPVAPVQSRVVPLPPPPQPHASPKSAPPGAAAPAAPDPAPLVPPPRTREEILRERQERVAYFKTQLAGLRERVARLERDLASLVSAGHGDRPAAVQFRQELEAARRAEPRMKRHLEQAEWEVRYGPLPAGSR